MTYVSGPCPMCVFPSFRFFAELTCRIKRQCLPVAGTYLKRVKKEGARHSVSIVVKSQVSGLGSHVSGLSGRHGERISFLSVYTCVSRAFTESPSPVPPRVRGIYVTHCFVFGSAIRFSSCVRPPRSNGGFALRKRCMWMSRARSMCAIASPSIPLLASRCDKLPSAVAVAGWSAPASFSRL